MLPNVEPTPTDEEPKIWDKTKNDHKTAISYPQDVETSRSNTSFLSFYAVQPFSYFEMHGEKDGNAKTVADSWKRFKTESLAKEFDGEKTDSIIHLYMPNLLVNTAHEYNDTAMSWAKNITDAVDATVKGYNDNGKGIDGAGVGLEELVKSGLGTLQKNVLSLFDKAAGGAFEQATGNVVNPKATTLYKGTALRTQTFTFQFKPSNLQEVAVTHEIIKRFRGFSSASITAGNVGFSAVGKKSDFLKIPHFWYLEEKLANTKAGYATPNRDLFKFGPAVLTNVRTNYTPDQYWIMFKSGDPVNVEMELSFTELIALTREDIMPSNGGFSL
jgi:hypothetical protein